MASVWLLSWRGVWGQRYGWFMVFLFPACRPGCIYFFAAAIAPLIGRHTPVQHNFGQTHSYLGRCSGGCTDQPTPLAPAPKWPPKWPKPGHLGIQGPFLRTPCGEQRNAKHNVYFVIGTRWDDRDEDHATPAFVFFATALFPALSLSQSFPTSLWCLWCILYRRILYRRVLFEYPALRRVPSLADPGIGTAGSIGASIQRVNSSVTRRATSLRASHGVSA